MPTKKANPAARTAPLDQRLLKALSHPLRVRLLSILNERVSSPVKLSKELGKSLGDVSYHVGVLFEYGLLELVDTKQRRGAVEHFYRGVERALIPPGAWKEMPAPVQKNIAADTFELIFEKAAKAVNAGAFGRRPDSHAIEAPLVLDEEGWGELVALIASTLDEAFGIQTGAAERLSKQKANGFNATVALAAFEMPPFPGD